jgi:hypothetical protein
MGLFTERDEETTNEIIIGKLNRIEAKLDAVIKALHEYDDDGYGESSFETFMDTKQSPCVKHDEASWDEERMDIIGQNGNEGSHYIDIDGNEFSDYGQRIAKEVMSDENNIRVGKDKSNDTQPKQKQYWKNNRSKRNSNKK